MEPGDFLASLSKLCVLHESGSDAEFKRSAENFASELGVDLSEADWSEWFRFDDGSIEECSIDDE